MLFDSFYNFKRLYKFSRFLAEYRVEFYLRNLPYGYFFSRPSKAPLPDLPQDPEDRLLRALAQSDTAVNSFARFLALYPDIVGEELAKSMSTIQTICLPQEDPLILHLISPNCKEKFVDLLSVLYWQAGLIDKKNKDTIVTSFIESFERLASSEMDMRIEAAALEHFKDNFYDSDQLSVVEIDWMNTTEAKLQAVHMPGYLPLSFEEKKTVDAFAKIQALMILRDGFFTPLNPTEWGLLSDGRLFLRKCSTSVRLSTQERHFISDFLTAFEKKEYAQAAKALFKAGLLPEMLSLLAVTRALESADLESDGFSIAQKADYIIKQLIQIGVSLPPYIMLILKALQNFEYAVQLEQPETTDPWASAKEEYDDFLRKGKLAESENASDFLNPSMQSSGLFADAQAVKKKKGPGFLDNPEKIPEMIKRGEAGYKFRSKK